MSKEWLVFILNLLVKNMYKLYLLVSRRGKTEGEDVSRSYYVGVC